jgi:hypothetical protein
LLASLPANHPARRAAEQKEQDERERRELLLRRPGKGI